MVGQFKKKLICVDQNSTSSHTRENSKMFNIISKYCSFFSNKLPASWVAHITRDFLTRYSCSYYSSMIRTDIFHSCDYALKKETCNVFRKLFPITDSIEDVSNRSMHKYQSASISLMILP